MADWGDVELQSWLDGGRSLPRVEASAGTWVNSVSSSGRKVFLPKEPWAEVSAGSAWLSNSSAEFDLRRTIGIFEIGSEFVKRCRSAIASDRDSGDSQVSQALLAQLSRDCLETISKLGLLQTLEVRYEALHVAVPGSLGTAYDHGARSLVGLHIDNEWLRGRSVEDGSNQDFGVVVANLGSAHRYLLFVRKSVFWIAQNLYSSSEALPSVEVLKDSLFEHAPTEPVMRVELPPGFAYFCNPQVVVHDGATSHQGPVDLALLIFGHYERLS